MMLESCAEAALTRKEAAAVILSIVQGPHELSFTAHFLESSGKRGFTAQDVYYILRSHLMEPGPPEMRTTTTAFRVRLLGKCLEGRKTRLVLDLRAEGPCIAVSIMEVTPSRQRRQSR